MRIFVDIGSHMGPTLSEVLAPRWAFDEVHAIEPMPRELAMLYGIWARDPRVRVHGFALGRWNGWTTMYGTNVQLEASIYPEKDDVDSTVRTVVDCRDAAEFFEQLPRGEVIVNLNAEGAEIPILERLVESEQIHSIAALLVDFDIRKVRGREAEEMRIRELLAAAGFKRFTSEYPEAPNHQMQIAAWLESVLDV